MFWILCVLNHIMVHILFPEWVHLVFLAYEIKTFFDLLGWSHQSLINEMRQQSNASVERRLAYRTDLHKTDTDAKAEILGNFSDISQAKIVNYGAGGMRLRIPMPIIDSMLYIQSKIFCGIASVCWSRKVSKTDFEVGLVYCQ